VTLAKRKVKMAVRRVVYWLSRNVRKEGLWETHEAYVKQFWLRDMETDKQRGGNKVGEARTSV